MSVAAAGVAVAGSVYGAWTQYKAGQEQQKMNQYNAQIAVNQEADAIKQGETEAAHYGTKARGLMGEQRASFAGQNVDVNSGTAAELQTQTEQIAKQDIDTIRVNAARQAWGYQTQAENFIRAGKNAYNGGLSNAGGSLLTGAGQLAGMYATRSALTNGTPKS